MRDSLNTYSRGWRECQPEENERIEQLRQKEMAKADDELQRGGDPLALLVSVVLCAAVIAIFIAGSVTAVRWAQERTIAPDTVHIVAS